MILRKNPPRLAWAGSKNTTGMNHGSGYPGPKLRMLSLLIILLLIILPDSIEHGFLLVTVGIIRLGGSNVNWQVWIFSR
jgi:hypothetical protein